MEMPDTVIRPRLKSPAGGAAKALVEPAGIETNPAKVVLSGMSSVNTTLTAGEPLDSVSVTVYRSVSAGATSPPFRSETVFVEVASEGPTTAVTSVAVLFVWLRSKLAELTVTVFVTDEGASPTFTVSVSAGKEAPAFRVGA
jgi:hypothetical protein